jgi:hypothetical protein
MKRILLLITFFIVCKVNIAQNSWCPTAAKWYYSSYCFGLNEAKKTVTYIKDSVLNTINCKYVKSEKTCAPPQNGSYSLYYFTYENNNVVYLYNANGIFDTLFNFNAAIGDKWFHYLNSSGSVGDTNSCNFWRSTVEVIDTGHVTINTFNLKKLALKYNQISRNFNNDTVHFYTIDTVYERIGSLYNGWCPITCEPYYMQTDGEYNGSFRCYEDSSFGLYHKLGTLACDSLQGVSLKEINSKSKLIIYPNPSSDKISIETTKNFVFPISVEILNSIGGLIKIIHFQKQTDIQININDIKEGLYFVKIVGEQNTFIKSFIKN